MKTRNIVLCLAALAASGAASRAFAQSGDVTINLNVTGESNWNVGTNWLTTDNLTVVPGDGYPQEVVSISNGGASFLSSAAGFPVDGILIGDAGGTSGKLEIRAGGSLNVVDAFPEEVARDGAVFVGVDGQGSLLVNGGTLNAAAVNVGGGSRSSLIASGSSTVNVSGDVNLNRTFRIEGSSVNFNVGGDLTVGGVYQAKITGANVSAIKVPAGAASIGGAAKLAIEFSGVTPAFGNSWTLIDAQSVIGDFSSVSVSGANLGRGLIVDTVPNAATGNVSAVVDNRLILKVNRQSGATSIENAVGEAITIDGYTIGSPDGHLLTTNARWSSLDDQNVGAFAEAAPTSHFLSELEPTGSVTLNVGATRSLGTPYQFTPSAFAQSGKDLWFEYTTPSGEIAAGIVEYAGPANNLVLEVDPASGKGRLVNQSTFTVAIDGYTISSASGSLNVAGWTSLDDQNLATWAEANPQSSGLSELLPVGGFTLTPNSVFNMGNLFSTTGLRDLGLTFTLSDGTQIAGEVAYGALTTALLGDTNGDNKVDLVDLNNVRNNFGGGGVGDTDADGDVDLTDLNNVRNNFGAAGSPSAVPEPSTFLLAGASLLGLGFARCRRH